MPQYKVDEPGFFNGKLYDPKGKRKVLTVDKPFKKDEMPSWVSPMEPETKKTKKSKKAADIPNPTDTSFMDGDKGSTVETL